MAHSENTWVSRSETPVCVFLWHSLHLTFCHGGSLWTFYKAEWENFLVGNTSQWSPVSTSEMQSNSSHSKWTIPVQSCTSKIGKCGKQQIESKDWAPRCICGALGPGRFVVCGASFWNSADTGRAASMGHRAEEWLSEELSSESIKQQCYLLITLDSIEREKKTIQHTNEILSVTPIDLPTN